MMIDSPNIKYVCIAEIGVGRNSLCIMWDRVTGEMRESKNMAWKPAKPLDARLLLNDAHNWVRQHYFGVTLQYPRQVRTEVIPDDEGASARPRETS
jgi:hypothetical protein